MINICAWSESKNNELSIWVVYKTFSHATVVYISMSSIGLDVHVQVY